MKQELPEAGDQYTFDYTFEDKKTEVLLTVVDVTDEHVMYKMVGTNHIYIMTHDAWCIDVEKMNPVCKHERGWIYNHRVILATLEMPSEETGRVECRDCDDAWELGYHPSGMDLQVAP